MLRRSCYPKSLAASKSATTCVTASISASSFSNTVSFSSSSNNRNTMMMMNNKFTSSMAKAMTISPISTSSLRFASSSASSSSSSSTSSIYVLIFLTSIATILYVTPLGHCLVAFVKINFLNSKTGTVENATTLSERKKQQAKQLQKEAEEDDKYFSSPVADILDASLPPGNRELARILSVPENRALTEQELQTLRGVLYIHPNLHEAMRHARATTEDELIVLGKSLAFFANADNSVRDAEPRFDWTLNVDSLSYNSCRVSTMRSAFCFCLAFVSCTKDNLSIDCGYNKKKLCQGRRGEKTRAGLVHVGKFLLGNNGSEAGARENVNNNNNNNNNRHYRAHAMKLWLQALANVTSSQENNNAVMSSKDIFHIQSAMNRFLEEQQGGK